MKKSLASLSIVSLLACTALTGCGEGYTYRDGYMLSFNGKDYTVEELFDHYNLKTSAGVKAMLLITLQSRRRYQLPQKWKN